MLICVYVVFNTDLVPWQIFQEQQQEDPTDEPEPFMGSGRFGNLVAFSVTLWIRMLNIRNIVLLSCDSCANLIVL